VSPALGKWRGAAQVALDGVFVARCRVDGVAGSGPLLDLIVNDDVLAERRTLWREPATRHRAPSIIASPINKPSLPS
jgi:hypothetical protein